MTAADKDTTAQTRDTPLRSMTFIVRISENESGGLSGIVEHAKTGKKHRFERVEAISGVIASMIVDR